MTKLNLRLGSILEILKSARRRHGLGDDPRLKAPQARRSSNLQRRSIRLGSSSIPDRFCSEAVIKEESDAFSFGLGLLPSICFRALWLSIRSILIVDERSPTFRALCALNTNGDKDARLQGGLMQ